MPAQPVISSREMQRQIRDPAKLDLSAAIKGATDTAGADAAAEAQAEAQETVNEEPRLSKQSGSGVTDADISRACLTFSKIAEKELKSEPSLILDSRSNKQTYRKNKKKNGEYNHVSLQEYHRGPRCHPRG